jgi:hypothetical protein
MGPQMNANTRKCKTHKFVCGARSVSMEFISCYRDVRTQNNHSLFICVHLRALADLNRYV